MKARYRLTEILLPPLPVAQGRVGRPGAAGELAPGDGGLGAQAEQVGDDGRRELAGELQERAGAAGDRVDADAGQPVADGGGQDGLSGMQAREQPRPGSAGGNLAEVAAVAGEVVQVAGEGSGMRIGVAPSVSVVCAASRLTWLVVRRAMRPGRWPNSRTSSPATRSPGSWPSSCRRLRASAHRRSWCARARCRAACPAGSSARTGRSVFCDTASPRCRSRRRPGRAGRPRTRRTGPARRRGAAAGGGAVRSRGSRLWRASPPGSKTRTPGRPARPPSPCGGDRSRRIPVSAGGWQLPHSICPERSPRHGRCLPHFPHRVTGPVRQLPHSSGSSPAASRTMTRTCPHRPQRRGGRE